MNTKISIIIPVYNVEKYIKRCIDSVLNQTYSNYEIILVDDGSTDLSGYICDEYSYIDKRVKVIHQNNGGLSGARDSGIKEVTGDYIMFVDSDDWIEQNTLQVLSKEILIGNYDLIIYGYIMEFIYDECKNVYVSPNLNIYNNAKDYVKQYSHYRSNGIFGFVWNKLYKADVIKKNDIFFEEYVFPEDVFFNFKFLPYCKNIKVIDNVLYHYIHQSMQTLSKTQRNEPYTSNNMYDKTVQFLKEMQCYEINEQYVSSFYTSALINYISSSILKDNKRVEKLKLLYDDGRVKYAVRKSNHNLLFYRIMNELMKFRLPITTILFIYTYKVYEIFKNLVRKAR